MNPISAVQHAASATLDPDKAPVIKLGGAAAVGLGKVSGIDVPDLIGWATLIFFVLQIVWILWRMVDKFRGKADRN